MSEVEVVAENATPDEAYDCEGCARENEHSKSWMNMMRDFQARLGAIMGLEGTPFVHFAMKDIEDRVTRLEELARLVRESFAADVVLGEATHRQMPEAWLDNARERARRLAAEVNVALIGLGFVDLGEQFPAVEQSEGEAQ